MGVIGCGLAMACTNLAIYLLQDRVMKAKLEIAEGAFSVKWNNRRNFEQVRPYLNLALPSLAILILEWSSGDVITILSGYISKNDQACFVIYLSIATTLCSSALGIGTAATTLVGQQIGQNKVGLAKKFAKGIAISAFAYTIVEAVCLTLLRQHLVDLFSRDAEVDFVGHNIFKVYLPYLVVDQWQMALAGVIRGIGK
jgi:MATE family multidrug resistance protein